MNIQKLSFYNKDNIALYHQAAEIMKNTMVTPEKVESTRIKTTCIVKKNYFRYWANVLFSTFKKPKIKL